VELELLVLLDDFVLLIVELLDEEVVLVEEVEGFTLEVEDFVLDVEDVFDEVEDFVDEVLDTSFVEEMLEVFYIVSKIVVIVNFQSAHRGRDGRRRGRHSSSVSQLINIQFISSTLLMLDNISLNNGGK
jgi:hypothetical protein